MVTACGFSPAADAQEARIELPAGPLAASIAGLARQAGVSIGIAGPLPARPAPRIAGRLSIEAALRRLLAGSGWRAVAVAPRVWRIERDPRPVARVQPKPVPPPPAPRAAVGPDIVVTASKRGDRLGTAPLAVAVVDGGRFDPLANGADAAAVASAVNGLFATNFGTGRDRLFVRGVADGPFDGFAQSSVAVYLGGIRATFDAPNPDLRLIDMRQVEVLKGPQGPLYGSGAIGGIYQMVPEAPDMGRIAGAVRAGVEAVEDGGIGPRADAMLNLPIVADRLALRLVAYHERDAGWIDEGARRDVNRGHVSGGRAAIGGRVGDWRIDLNAATQSAARDDSQYVEARGARRRAVRLAEPQDTDFTAAGVTATGPVGAMTATLTAGSAWQELRTDYDASSAVAAFGVAPPALYRDARAYHLVSGEARLAGRLGAVDWLAGLSWLSASTRATGRIGSAQVLRIDREIDEKAGFGEATVPLGGDVSATVGARVFATSVSDDRRTRGDDRGYSDTTVRASPSASLAWQRGRLFLYGRLASALRPGGVQAAANGLPGLRYEADELIEADLGARWHAGGWTIDAGLFGSRWDHVQADVLSDTGLVSTYNAGRAANRGIDASVTWQARAGVSLTAGVLAQHARIRTDIATGDTDRRLPIVPDLALRGEARVTRHLGEWAVDGRLSARYLGEARLSFDPRLDRESEPALTIGAGIGASRDGWDVRLSAENLTDARADTFSFGNPFTALTTRQFTPMRPRTLSLSLGRRF